MTTAHPLGAVDMLRLYTTGSAVHTGGRHLANAQNGQDHAVTICHREAIVLAVADGVSRVNHAPSRAEVGAILTAEIAARAAADGARHGLAPKDLRAHVAAALLRHLASLHVALGGAAASLLHCTLVLGVTTPDFTAVWLVGDGSWGASGSLAHGSSPRAACPVACYGRRWECHGARHEPVLGQTVYRLCQTGDIYAVARGFECVLEAEGPALGLYVATDGLADEPGARALLRSPLRDDAALRHALIRDIDSDDLAVAWATTRSAELEAERLGPRILSAPHDGHTPHPDAQLSGL